MTLGEAEAELARREARPQYAMNPASVVYPERNEPYETPAKGRTIYDWSGFNGEIKAAPRFLGWGADDGD